MLNSYISKKVHHILKYKIFLIDLNLSDAFSTVFRQMVFLFIGKLQDCMPLGLHIDNYYLHVEDAQDVML